MRREGGNGEGEAYRADVLDRDVRKGVPPLRGEKLQGAVSLLRLPRINDNEQNLDASKDLF